MRAGTVRGSGYRPGADGRWDLPLKRWGCNPGAQQPPGRRLSTQRVRHAAARTDARRLHVVTSASGNNCLVSGRCCSVCRADPKTTPTCSDAGNVPCLGIGIGIRRERAALLARKRFHRYFGRESHPCRAAANVGQPEFSVYQLVGDGTCPILAAGNTARPCRWKHPPRPRLRQKAPYMSFVKMHPRVDGGPWSSFPSTFRTLELTHNTAQLFLRRIPPCPAPPLPFVLIVGHRKS
jgi:hypothetical protein